MAPPASVLTEAEQHVKFTRLVVKEEQRLAIYKAKLDHSTITLQYEGLQRAKVRNRKRTFHVPDGAQ